MCLEWKSKKMNSIDSKRKKLYMNPTKCNEIITGNIFHHFFFFFRITWIFERIKIVKFNRFIGRSYLVHHSVWEWRYVWWYIDYYPSNQSNLIMRKYLFANDELDILPRFRMFRYFDLKNNRINSSTPWKMISQPVFCCAACKNFGVMSLGTPTRRNKLILVFVASTQSNPIIPIAKLLTRCWFLRSIIGRSTKPNIDTHRTEIEILLCSISIASW